MATSGRDESISLSAAIKGGGIGPKLAGDNIEIYPSGVAMADDDDASDEEDESLARLQRTVLDLVSRWQWADGGRRTGPGAPRPAATGSHTPFTYWKPESSPLRLRKQSRKISPAQCCDWLVPIIGLLEGLQADILVARQWFSTDGPAPALFLCQRWALAGDRTA
ncbi:unnamed protein product [Clonostachys solani]|uniref:Uncharacterized protein n=1 Tax=Clonostachys solani TaxID=160281 RepID=A0A9N9ZC43_9HYPO|nr:unnamed protein product [Clonostachys solani]